MLAIIGYGWLTDFRSMGAWFLILVIALALLGEVVEAWIGFRFAQRYGGSRRAGWGALIGGLIGALVGVPLPVIGSVIGGFVGAFLGAAVFEYTRARQAEGAARAGWGAVLGAGGRGGDQDGTGGGDRGDGGGGGDAGGVRSLRAMGSSKAESIVGLDKISCR